MSIVERGAEGGQLKAPSDAEVSQEKGVHREYRLHMIDVDDPYISDEATFLRIQDELQELSSMGYYGDTSTDLLRKRNSSIDRNNPSTAALIEKLPTFSDWLDLVPTAAALDSLYDPHKGVLANGKPLSPELAEWFCNIVDGRGIRSRAEIVRGIMIDDAESRDSRSRWLSLASGAAQPVIKTAAMLRDDGVPTPALTLVDVDPRSLKLARGYAEDAGVHEYLSVRRMNILQPQGIDRDERESDSLERRQGRFSAAAVSLRGLIDVARGDNFLPREFYDTVEVVGLTEYLKEENWGKTKEEKTLDRQRKADGADAGDEKYVYQGVIEEGDRPFAGAKAFLRNAYKLVRPGGSLIVGNMLDTHPQLGFTLNVIQWPHIQPRSIDAMMGIFDRAGIDGDTDVYTAPDGAYAIYRIKKQK